MADASRGNLFPPAGRVPSERAKQLGIGEFVMKPLVRKELAETVRKAIEGRK